MLGTKSIYLLHYLLYAIFSSTAGNSYNISESISKHVVLSLFLSISHARVSFSTVQVSKKTRISLALFYPLLYFIYKFNFIYSYLYINISQRL